MIGRPTTFGKPLGRSGAVVGRQGSAVAEIDRTWWLEDFEAGQVFVSQGSPITETDVTSFAAWSWDANPVHTDAVAAARGRFGQPIAHGLLGMSVALGLVSRVGVFEGCSVALLGVDGWR